MSMIDTSDKSFNKSPFNDLSRDNRIPQNPFDGIHLKSESLGDKLSTRAAIFTAFMMIAVCLMLPSFTGDKSAFAIAYLWVIGACAVYVLLWSAVMRVFESPDMMPVSIVVNLIPAALLSIFLGDKLPLAGLVFLGAGLTALTLEAADEKDRKAGKKKEKFTGIDFLSGEVVKYTEFIKADVTGEVLIPALCAVFASTAGVGFSELFAYYSHASGKSLRVIISALVLMLMSLVISKIRGKEYLFSSSEMSDAAILPMTTYKHIRSFVLRRGRFFVSIVLIGAGCILSDYLNVRFALGMPFMKHILCALLVFAFAFIRGRQSKHRIQFATELAVIYSVSVTLIFSIGDLVLMSLLATIADVVITAMMYTRNRRLIMSRRSRYVAGMPVELMTVAVIFMAVEVVMAYWGIVL